MKASFLQQPTGFKFDSINPVSYTHLDVYKRQHRLSTKTFVIRADVIGNIDSALHENYFKEVEYWHRVLKRVVDVIKFLGTRGLAIHGGSKEKFGILGNGNFLGSLRASCGV